MGDSDAQPGPWQLYLTYSLFWLLQPVSEVGVLGKHWQVQVILMTIDPHLRSITSWVARMRYKPAEPLLSSCSCRNDVPTTFPLALWFQNQNLA